MYDALYVVFLTLDVVTERVSCNMSRMDVAYVCVDICILLSLSNACLLHARLKPFYPVFLMAGFSAFDDDLEAE